MVDTCADANPTIATQPRAVIQVEGDDLLEEHQHHQDEGGQGGSNEEEGSGSISSPEGRRKAKPWKPK